MARHNSFKFVCVYKYYLFYSSQQDNALQISLYEGGCYISYNDFLQLYQIIQIAGISLVKKADCMKYLSKKATTTYFKNIL